MTLVLNLGCGTKVGRSPDVVNIDWSPYLRIARNPILRLITPALLDNERARRLRTMSQNIRVHNLRKGIPYPAHSVDVVYHSHLLEHLDRDVAPAFFGEVLRVLRPGGIHRIVVPDLECLCRNLLDDLNGEGGTLPHDAYIAALLEQSVRREAHGTSRQHWLRRRAENLILGDARERGETHQWMYDAKNLGELLKSCGFVDVTLMAYDQSNVTDWAAYGLDTDADGGPHKPDSLYVEARVPLR